MSRWEQKPITKELSVKVKHLCLNLLPLLRAVLFCSLFDATYICCIILFVIFYSRLNIIFKYTEEFEWSFTKSWLTTTTLNMFVVRHCSKWIHIKYHYSTWGWQSAYESINNTEYCKMELRFSYVVMFNC